MVLDAEINAVTLILLLWLKNPDKFWWSYNFGEFRSLRNYLEPLLAELIKSLQEVNPENIATLQYLQNENLDERETAPESECETLRNMLQKAGEQNPEIENLILSIYKKIKFIYLNNRLFPKDRSDSTSCSAGDNSKQIGQIEQATSIDLGEPFPNRSFVKKYIDIFPEHTIDEKYSQSFPFLYVHADMDDVVIINHTVTLDVEVSRELDDWYESEASKTGRIEINDTRKLLIQVIPKANFDLDGEDRVEVEVSTLGSPVHFYFDLKANYLGKGEVWVVARQNQIPLTTLKLKPKIVQRRAELQVLKKTAQNQTLFNPPPLTEPLNQLFITEHFHGQEVSYRYELISPALGIMGCYESDVIRIDRNEYIKNLYQEIEERWVSSQEDLEAFAAELRAFGGQLWDELFPRELQEVLWAHWNDINSIMVISSEPFIPWELVHLKPPGQHNLPHEVRFLGQMGLVRWLYDVGWPPNQIKIRPSQVYYVIPHYPLKDYQLLEAEQESHFLEDKFQAVSIEPQPNSVRSLISRPNQFDLLHFACHGVAEHNKPLSAKLLLEGCMKQRQYCHAYLSATTVKEHSNLNTLDNRPMVVLNACQVGRAGYSLTGVSGFAQAFLNGGAGAFVGPLWSVGDTPARIFTETLYSQLLEGQELAQATTTARHAAQATGDATWLAYAVYGHPHLKLCFTPD